jgi:Na+/H+-dicarboxylate symporter
VLRPFGLSYEVAVPLMIIIDPLADMLRTMLNVAINCMIPTLAGGRVDTTQSSPQLAPEIN